MKNEEINHLSESLFEEMCRAEYIPNPLENYDTFKKKKEYSFDKDAQLIMNSVVNGILLFSLLENDNQRIINTCKSLIELSKNEVLSINTDAVNNNNLNESNLFGLEEIDFDYMLKMADTVWDVDDFSEAIDMYIALTILFPTRVESWLKWANAESKQFFDYIKVLSIYDRCLKIFNHPAVYFAKGVCQIKGNEPLLAKDCFEKAVELCDAYNEIDLKNKIVDLLNEMQSINFN